MLTGWPRARRPRSCAWAARQKYASSTSPTVAPSASPSSAYEPVQVLGELDPRHRQPPYARLEERCEASARTCSRSDGPSGSPRCTSRTRLDKRCAGLRAYFEELVAMEVTAAAFRSGSAIRPASRRCGRWADRWLGAGGRGVRRPRLPGRSSSSSSWTRAGGPAPTPFLSINTVGQTIMQFDHPGQGLLPAQDPGRRPALLDRLHQASSGTDLASLTTKAVKDGDEWVINGQKIYTSLAQLRRLHLARRPHRPGRPQHQGVYDLRRADHDPGYSYSKISTMVNASTFNTADNDAGADSASSSAS